jgi:threonine/homoserine/homoserine lactone efflux protein
MSDLFRRASASRQSRAKHGPPRERSERGLPPSRRRGALLSCSRVDPLLGAYLTFTAILVVTPGSTTAVVVRNTLAGGRAGGFAAAFGAATGNTTHATAAGLGLAVVFARWPIALTALRIAGAAYLAWLGARSVYRVAIHPDGGVQMLSQTPQSSSVAEHAGSFRQGLTVNLLNPAVATFYLVVVPSFIPSAAAHWYFALLAAMHIAMALTCHGAWVLGLDTLRQLFRPPLARRILECATGIALLGLAVRVLTQ